MVHPRVTRAFAGYTPVGPTWTIGRFVAPIAAPTVRAAEIGPLTGLGLVAEVMAPETTDRFRPTRTNAAHRPAHRDSRELRRHECRNRRSRHLLIDPGRPQTGDSNVSDRLRG